MFHTVEQNVIILVSHRLAYFVSVTKLHKGKENNIGFGRGWGVLKRSSSDGYKFLFLRGGYSTRNWNHCFVRPQLVKKYEGVAME